MRAIAAAGRPSIVADESRNFLQRSHRHPRLGLCFQHINTVRFDRDDSYMGERKIGLPACRIGDGFRHSAGDPDLEDQISRFRVKFLLIAGGQQEKYTYNIYKRFHRNIIS